jgi:hypothetical protein
MPDQRVRKPFSPPYCSILSLARAHSSQGLPEIRTLAGMSWSEVDLSTIEHNRLPKLHPLRTLRFEVPKAYARIDYF